MSGIRLSKAEKTLSRISAKKEAPKLGFFILIVLFLTAVFMVMKVSRSDELVTLFGITTPIGTFAGVFSAIANICIIFLVVFYKRTGFIFSLVALMYQIPSLIINIIRSRSLGGVPGVFTYMLTLAAIILLYINNENIKKYQTRLRMQAVTDTLTKLPNRFAATELMTDLIKRGEGFAIATFDLDNFKNINNTMGHSTGDAILTEIGRRWNDTANNESTGTMDFVSYYGGDEFALVIREFRSDEELVRTLERYEAVLEEKMTIDDCDYYITSSIGYSLSPHDADTVDALMGHANTAMYRAKRTGERIYRYSRDISEYDRMLDLERDIRYAIDNDTLTFNLQPQFDIDHRLRGFEALARMKDQDGNSISPAEFIPAAEKIGLIDRIDHIVFRKAASFFGELIRKTGTEAMLSVNVSVRHIMKNDFMDDVRSVIESCGVPAEQIEIEITESVMIDSVDKALDCIKELKDMGIKIAIDDFGTGYSSLSYLNEFPADLLKVDKSFIDLMNTSESSKQYVSAIISMGHVMNFEVISEGVEEPEQLETLRDIGCDFIQGYIWGKPMEAEEAAKLVEVPA